jgi:hypothetical protein
LRASDMTSPGPSRIYVMLAERADSINDGSFAVMRDATPSLRGIVDWPSNYHNQATCGRSHRAFK